MAKKKAAAEAPITVMKSDDLIDQLNLEEFEGIGDAIVIRNYEPFVGLPTGSLSADWALGNGRGIPRGQLTQISGHKGSGKTSLTIITAANTIANGGKVVIWDLEYRFNVEHAYYSGMGYPGKNYMLMHPRSAEDALNYVVYFAKQGYDLGILDSVGGLSTKKEIDGELEDSTYAANAKLLSQFFRMRMPDIAMSNMALVFINQIRTKMNVMYGSPEMRMGGKAIEFYTSVGLEMKNPNFEEFEYESASDKKLRENPLGIMIEGKTWKNSVCAPFRGLSLQIRFQRGVMLNRIQEALDFGAAYGVFTAGSGGKPTAGTKWVHGEKTYGSITEITNEMTDPQLLSYIIEEIRERMSDGSR